MIRINSDKLSVIFHGDIIEELKTQITDYKKVDLIRFLDSESFINYLSKHKDFLNSFDNVASISFHETRITRDFSFKLAEYLQENTKIQNIDFGHLHSNISEISSILTPLFVVKDRLKSLEILSIESHPYKALDELTMDELMGCIGYLKAFETLIFSSDSKKINDGYHKKLAKIIQSNRELKKLQLYLREISSSELLELYKSLDDTKIEDLYIDYCELDDEQSSSNDVLIDLRLPELKSLHVCNENKYNSALISKNTNLQELFIYNFRSRDYFLKVIEAIKSNQSLKIFKINFILSNAALVKKLALAIELHKNLEEIHIDNFFEGNEKLPYFESASSLIYINIPHDAPPEDQITPRYENFSECFEIFLNSLEHNFKITSSCIISIFNHFLFKLNSLENLNPENKKNIQEVIMPRIEGLNKKMKDILARNQSFSEELRQDITDFKSGLINELTLKIVGKESLERAVAVTNAVIDYFVLPIIATDEKSTKLNQIFTEFERQFSDKKKNDLSTNFTTLISLIATENQSPAIGREEYPPKLNEIIIKKLFSETLDDQLEKQVKFRQNLKELNLTNVEKKYN